MFESTVQAYSGSRTVGSEKARVEQTRERWCGESGRTGELHSTLTLTLPQAADNTVEHVAVRPCILNCSLVRGRTAPLTQISEDRVLNKRIEHARQNIGLGVRMGYGSMGVAHEVAEVAKKRCCQHRRQTHARQNVHIR